MSRNPFVCPFGADSVFAQFQQLMDTMGPDTQRESKLATETQLLLVRFLM